MKFTLHYRGPLKANGKPRHKHEIRKHFHKQLVNLWNQKPLAEQKMLLEVPKKKGHYSLVRDVGNLKFAPLITEQMDVIAELKVTMLRPESPGNILAPGGDIDNRMKTLFDALTLPPHENQVPPEVTQEPEFDPLFLCVFEDDNLITDLTVRTGQLLEPSDDNSEVVANIEITTRILRTTFGNMA